MECPTCGARNLPHAAVCTSCDADLPREDGEEEVDPLIGQTVAGKYEVTAIIGIGSMGTVYAATQADLDREIALKVLHPHVAADPKVERRFHREARTASRLSHPNTVQVFDYGKENDGSTLYIAMELLDGPDLLEIVDEESPLTPRRIGHLVGEVLFALEEAHDHGVIHRDLKPENIVVVEDHQGREHVKVCDFGIAKLVEHEGSALTVTGFVCGTPEYMAPEQARGEPLDGRADLYAIGCLLHHLLVGEPPFRGPSALGTITQHLTEEVVPPSRRRPDLHVPHALDEVCMRALQKDRDDRYPDAAAMRAALEEAVDALGELAADPLGTHTDDPTAPPPPTPPAAPSRWGLPLLMALGVALLVGVAIHASRSEEPAPPPLEPLASAPEDAAATEAPADAADPPSGGATRAAAAEAESTAEAAGVAMAGVATGADDSAPTTMGAELATARLGAARSEN
ncbi:MAG TPA: serine/threonine-protein kinase, partial [Polyangiaceae bacterium LLY-WYZ-15_(1-7)]|nr:serine/threonine-protein kinase [Polyangiaceae bacterium LLY-WYZ-15_(1-7)]